MEKYQKYKSNFKDKSKDNFHRKDKIDKIIDLKNDIKSQEFKGYAVWAKQHNLKNMAKTLKLMNVYGIANYEDLNNNLEKVNLDLMKVSSKVKSIENKSEALAMKLKYIETYRQYKPIFIEFEKSKNKDLYYKSHTNEILLYEAAKAYLGDIDLKDTLPSTATLKDKLRELDETKKEIMNEYNKRKEKVSELNFVKSNLETYMQWEKPEINLDKEY